MVLPLVWRLLGSGMDPVLPKAPCPPAKAPCPLPKTPKAPKRTGMGAIGHLRSPQQAQPPGRVTTPGRWPPEDSAAVDPDGLIAEASPPDESSPEDLPLIMVAGEAGQPEAIDPVGWTGPWCPDCRTPIPIGADRCPPCAESYAYVREQMLARAAGIIREW
jgi:hypothetical protein